MITVARGILKYHYYLDSGTPVFWVDTDRGTLEIAVYDRRGIYVEGKQYTRSQFEAWYYRMPEKSEIRVNLEGLREDMTHGTNAASAERASFFEARVKR